jgi:hypothetical protein
MWRFSNVLRKIPSERRGNFGLVLKVVGPHDDEGFFVAGGARIADRPSTIGAADIGRLPRRRDASEPSTTVGQQRTKQAGMYYSPRVWRSAVPCRVSEPKLLI